MYDLLVQSPEVAVVLGLTITSIAIAGMVIWSNHLKAQSDAELKLNMLDRGMPVDEIERVLAAKSTTPKPPALQFGFHKREL